MTTMNAALTGGGAGLVGAVGILTIITALRRRRPTLMARLEPYVHRQPTTSGLLTAPAGLASDGRTVVGLLMASTAGTLNLGRLLDSLGSSADSVRRRLTRSGSPLSLDQFRLQQVLWSTTALLLVLAAGGLAALVRSVNVPALIVLSLMATVSGAAARDWWLSRAVAKRLSRIETQLPDVVELLALAVGAGQGPVAAIERVVALGRGDLIDELGTTLTDIRSGTVLSTALDRMERRVGSVHVTRLCEAIVVALERGTPLAEVLRSQATDVREAARQDLMEEGGRREIAQMVPVVFLVLPITSSSPSSQGCSSSGWGCERIRRPRISGSPRPLSCRSDSHLPARSSHEAHTPSPVPPVSFRFQVMVVRLPVPDRSARRAR